MVHIYIGPCLISYAKSDLAIKHRKNLLIAGANDCKEHMMDRGM